MGEEQFVRAGLYSGGNDTEAKIFDFFESHDLPTDSPEYDSLIDSVSTWRRNGEVSQGYLQTLLYNLSLDEETSNDFLTFLYSLDIPYLSPEEEDMDAFEERSNGVAEQSPAKGVNDETTSAIKTIMEQYNSPEFNPIPKEETAKLFEEYRVLHATDPDGLSPKDAKRRERRMKAIRDKVTYSNIRFIIWRVRRFCGWGIPLEDLVQYGVEGLLRAVDSYDPQKATFTTYASFWIDKRVLAAIAQEGRLIRFPQNFWEAKRKIDKFSDKFFMEHGRQPTADEIAANVKVSRKRIDSIVNGTAAMTVVQDQNLYPEGDDTLISQWQDPNAENAFAQIDGSDLSSKISDAIRAVLTPLEAVVARLLFGLEDGTSYTLENIGRILGFSKESIRGIGKDIKTKLQAYLANTGIAPTRAKTDTSEEE